MTAQSTQTVATEPQHGAEITVPQLRLREIDAEGAALGEPARAASAG